MSGAVSRRRRIALLLLLATGASGCMPHVLHSPRVERGTTGVVAGSLGRNLDADDDSPTYVPSLYGGARLAPYVQLGRLGERGGGWYTTQGVGITGDPLFADGLFWLGSLMWRDTGREGSGKATHVGVAGGVGRDGSDAVWWLGIAVIAEFGLPAANR